VLSADCYTVRLLLSLLHLRCEIVAVDVHPGRRQGPHGAVPALEDGDAVCVGLRPILLHLAARDDAKPDWLPPADAAAIGTWLDFAAEDLAPLSAARLVSIFGAAGDLPALNAAGRRALRHLDDHLVDRRMDGAGWLVGDRPTLADIAVFAPVMLSHDSGVGHEDYAAINLWQRRVRRLDGFVGMPGIPDYF
jgi:glutathione S-transferase